MVGKTVPLGFVALAILASPFFVTGLVQIELDTQQGFDDVLSTFGKLFIVAVLMERAVEVILSTLRSAGADRLDGEMSGIEKEIQEAERERLRETATVDERKAAEVRIETSRSALALLVEQRGAFRAGSRIYALWIGVIMGLLVAAVGIRFLGTIVILPAGIAPAQKSWFVVIDILLTGMLLAGGSDAFNKVTKTVGAFMDKIKSANQ